MGPFRSVAAARYGVDLLGFDPLAGVQAPSHRLSARRPTSVISPSAELNAELLCTNSASMRPASLRELVVIPLPA